MKSVLNSVVKLFSALLLLAVFNHANAYYLEHALPGVVTVAVKGACEISTFAAKAYYADVHTDEHVLLGRGVVTAAGQLIALEENHSDVSYLHVLATHEKSETDYVDYVGDALRTFLTANGADCHIETLEPDVDSRAVYHWNETGGSLNLKVAFGGHEKSRCFAGMTQERCFAKKIRGVIRFKSTWQNAR